MTDMDLEQGLYFVPLGGTGEIGMNLYAYGCDGWWLIVDCGIAFGDESTPGIDIRLPDTSFLEDNRGALVGIVLTHAHEDHFGAIPYLWEDLGCPVYCTPFAASFLRLKLAGSGISDSIQINEVAVGGTVKLGPFDVTLVGVTHSIPEPNALIIDTPHGRLAHSGDWKIDPAPQIGPTMDFARLREAGRSAGILALMGDSTNAMEPGHSRSEQDVLETLTRVIGEQTGRVAVTCFSTNLARLQSVSRAAHAAGRHCALVGRSLWRIHQAAGEVGLLDVPEPFLREDEAAHLPADKVVLICAGSQGEPRSALTRIARDDHPNIVLEPGDTVIYSSREIPGNEKPISRVQNDFVAAGIKLITADDDAVHASGHPCQEELVELYQTLKPRMAIPIHGERRHLAAHARLARQCQTQEILIPSDGMVIRLDRGTPEVVDQLQLSPVGYDGDRVVRLDTGLMRDRHRLLNNGIAVVTVIVDRAGQTLAPPSVSVIGLAQDPEERQEMASDVAAEVTRAVNGLNRDRRREQQAIEEAALRAARRTLRDWTGKRTVTEVFVVRLGSSAA